MNIQGFLLEKISGAFISAGAPRNSNIDIRPSKKPQFGDYQVNGIMSIAKTIGISPKQLAKKILPLIRLENIASKIEIAGPGFINIFLDKRWIEKQIEVALWKKKLAISPVTPQTVIVDYSSPNIAKQMHVGHLRSTIIGDAVVRTLEFLGHRVIRANHIGDWGTQFGMLIAYLKKIQQKNLANISLPDLEKFYQEARKCYDTDTNFAELARNYVVKLQTGDKYCRKIWNKLINITIEHNQKIYQRLNVTLTKDDIMGESLYNDMLPDIVSDLYARGLAVKNDGAIVVYLDEFKNKNGDKMGVIIQKKDGAYLYITTDIACAKYRYEVLHADRVLYYIDSRQHQHFMQACTILRKAGYIPNTMSLEYHIFGMMLDKNGKPFRTRAGKTILLNDLLDEAIKRADHLIRQKNPRIEKKELQSVVQAVGIGAIKYNDLSKNRTTNYVFSWDNMLSFEGNTAPYMQYAYSRVSSIFKRVDINPKTLKESVTITNKYEQSLAIRLLQFEETIFTVAQEGLPHIMCNYLYSIANLFSIFYEHCPILNTKSKIEKATRLKLAFLTKKTLKIGLDTLGIKTVEKM